MIEDVGTLLYQAPEVIDGLDYDGWADIWSLGCVIFVLANSRIDITPFTAN
jgi:serine/threonine protein kinase